MTEEKYMQDIEAILSHQYDNGDDYWTTADRRLIKGVPFSAYTSVLMLLELGLDANEPLLQTVAQMFWDAWQKDGRFKLYPQGGILPCHTALGAHLLCKMGEAQDERMQITFRYLLESKYKDGGWRCNKFSYGRGPETEYSNPGPTLTILNAFRFSSFINKEPSLEKAVEFLLWHWTVKKPIGPCHYGIGTLFMQVQYPFGGYNLFEYVYVLSHYEYARKDSRFKESLAMLQSKLVEDKIIVERVVPKLAKLNFCKKGKASDLATERYEEIIKNIG